jgi:hypothetical protein
VIRPGTGIEAALWTLWSMVRSQIRRVHINLQGKNIKRVLRRRYDMLTSWLATSGEIMEGGEITVVDSTDNA